MKYWIYILCLIQLVQAQEYSAFEQSILDQGMEDVQAHISDVVLDVKYATEDNFTKKLLYTDMDHVFMRPEAIKKLVKADKYLKEKDSCYTFLIYDGGRPNRIQHIMWDVVKGTDGENYVANPYRGSIHNYGSAIDLSIAKDGVPIDMGTDYDYFGKLAQPRYNDYYLKIGKLTKEQVENRKLLRQVMTQAGFRPINNEWWHFNAFSIKYVRANFKMIK